LKILRKEETEGPLLFWTYCLTFAGKDFTEGLNLALDLGLSLLRLNMA